MEAAEIDMVADCILEIMSAVSALFGEQDESKKVSKAWLKLCQHDPFILLLFFVVTNIITVLQSLYTYDWKHCSR